MRLESFTIHKYKSFLLDQKMIVEPDTTCIVGKNESGKSAILECLSKVNYFDKNDKRFMFDETFDYPKNEWKVTQDSSNQPIITLTFSLDEHEKTEIDRALGIGVREFDEFSISRKFNGSTTYDGIKTNIKKYLSNLTETTDLPEESLANIKSAKTIKELKEVIFEIKPDSLILCKIKIIEDGADGWDNQINGYIAKSILEKFLPSFWYFDEYYTLPGKIDLQKVASNQYDEVFTEDNLKISKSLMELARINIDDLVKSPNYESYISELEATSNAITDELFEYWKTNKHIEIKFDIESVPEPNNPGIRYQRRFLNVRIRNNRHRVSLPLGNRSKGFIWFFSFLVWFSKIQTDRSKQYIILLDEPGLNLHASAQADLLRYINEKLTPNYQVIYTTHSPFMVETKNIHRVRTVFDTLDPKKGSIISDSIQEKDPDTLFPLQAALGYDIAQNLFISTNNLLVEGPGDLVYFEILNDILGQLGKNQLRDDITVVPVGGLDKVGTFISLLRGQKLNIACILDTFTDQKGKKKVDDLIMLKIIKDKNVIFFDEFTDNGSKISDIEDMFEKSEYLNYYNIGFGASIKESDLPLTNEPITRRIAFFLGKPRYNHYIPAIAFMKSRYDKTSLSSATVDRFDKLFERINSLF